MARKIDVLKNEVGRLRGEVLAGNESETLPAGESTASPPAASANGQASTPQKIPEAVKSRIKSKLAQFGEIASMGDFIVRGHLQLFELDRIQNILGNLWPAFRIRVFDAIDKTLEQYLSDGDVYLRTSDDFYLVAFREPDLDLAQKTLTSVRLQVLEYCARTMAKGHIPELNTSQVRQDSKSFIQDLSMITKTYKTVDDLGGQKAAAEKTVSPAPAADPATAAEPVKPAEPELSLGQLEYYPTWDAKAEAVIGYSLLPARRVLGPRQEEDIEAECVATDLGILGEGLGVADKLICQDNKFMLNCPLSFHTVEDRVAFRIFLNLCKEQEKRVQKLVNIEIDGLDLARNAVDLAETRKFLDPYCRNVILAVGPEDLPHLRKVARAKVRIISLDLKCRFGKTTVASLREWLPDFVKKARWHDLEIAFGDVADGEIAEYCVAHHARFLNGPVLGNTLKMPKPIYRLAWNELAPHQFARTD